MFLREKLSPGKFMFETATAKNGAPYVFSTMTPVKLSIEILALAVCAL